MERSALHILSTDVLENHIATVWSQLSKLDMRGEQNIGQRRSTFDCLHRMHATRLGSRCGVELSGLLASLAESMVMFEMQPHGALIFRNPY
jgi:hypothetical protein